MSGEANPRRIMELGEMGKMKVPCWAPCWFKRQGSTVWKGSLNDKWNEDSHEGMNSWGSIAYRKDVT